MPNREKVLEFLEAPGQCNQLELSIWKVMPSCALMSFKSGPLINVKCLRRCHSLTQQSNFVLFHSKPLYGTSKHFDKPYNVCLDSLLIILIFSSLNRVSVDAIHCEQIRWKSLYTLNFSKSKRSNKNLRRKISICDSQRASYGEPFSEQCSPRNVR